MNETRPYPIDFSILKKGDFISPEMIEDALHISRDDKDFKLKVLDLRDQIMREMEARGVPVTVKCENDGLRILTDEEAAEYNPKLFKQGLNRAASAHRRDALVDVSNLTDESKSKHLRNLVVQGKILQAVSDTRREIEVEPYRRQTPGLPKKES